MLLWVYGHYEYENFSTRGSTSDYRREILTSKVGPRAEWFNAYVAATVNLERNVTQWLERGALQSSLYVVRIQTPLGAGF